MRQLRQEADGVHVQDRHVTGQLAGVDGDIQGGEKLVSGLKTTVTSQGFDQSRFSCTNKGSVVDISTLKPRILHNITAVCISHHSLCIPAQRRRGTPCVYAAIAAGASSSAVSPALSGSSSPAPSAASAGSPAGSHL